MEVRRQEVITFCDSIVFVFGWCMIFILFVSLLPNNNTDNIHLSTYIHTYSAITPQLISCLNGFQQEADGWHLLLLSDFAFGGRYLECDFPKQFSLESLYDITHNIHCKSLLFFYAVVMLPNHNQIQIILFWGLIISTSLLISVLFGVSYAIM